MHCKELPLKVQGIREVLGQSQKNISKFYVISFQSRDEIHD